MIDLIVTTFESPMQFIDYCKKYHPKYFEELNARMMIMFSFNLNRYDPSLKYWMELQSFHVQTEMEWKQQDYDDDLISVDLVIIKSFDKVPILNWI